MLNHNPAAYLILKILSVLISAVDSAAVQTVEVASLMKANFRICLCNAIFPILPVSKNSLYKNLVSS